MSLHKHSNSIVFWNSCWTVFPRLAKGGGVLDTTGSSRSAKLSFAWLVSSDSVVSLASDHKSDFSRLFSLSQFQNEEFVLSVHYT